MDQRHARTLRASGRCVTPSHPRLRVVQDVAGAPKHHTQFMALKRYLERAEWPAWPAKRLDMTPEHCGCGTYGGSMKSPFGPLDFWYAASSWWLGVVLPLAC